MVSLDVRGRHKSAFAKNRPSPRSRPRQLRCVIGQTSSVDAKGREINDNFFFFLKKCIYIYFKDVCSGMRSDVLK